MQSLRDLPSIDRLLGDAALAPLVAKLGAITVRGILREAQDEVRRSARTTVNEAPASLPDWAFSAAGYAQYVSKHAHNLYYQPVFNLTGTVIHTNLGRALLSEELLSAVSEVVTRPTNLEYDLERGRRGQRDQIVAQRLTQLIGCEAATVVNNNAAALLIVLNTLALGKSVPVSRGELIEIGGSFRLPELMARAGCHLVEVGTTNRTHLKDYAAEAEDAALMLKVHPSNYHIQGFSTEVAASELGALAREHNIPSCVDLGAGTLVDLSKWGLPKEPTPQSVLEQDIDLVTFSGDKLLGGVQAGIIVGKQSLIDEINRNPLKRALRADKVTLAILEQTLTLYEQPDTLADTLPLLKTLTLDAQTLTDYADKVCAAVPDTWQAEIVDSQVQMGSGSLPDQSIPSVAVRLQHSSFKVDAAAQALRCLPTPVIGRISNDAVLLDMRGAERIDELTQVLSELPV